jgi:hypothetical protein
MLTLMRLSEIRLLTREQVHLDQGIVLLPKAKAGSRALILSSDAQKLLRTQLEQIDSASHGRSQARTAARIPDVISAKSLGRLRGPLGFETSISTTCGTSAPRWRSTRASPRLS